MTSTNAQRLRARDLLKARGMLRLREFVAEGIGPETLARLVREEAVIRPARGLYQLPYTQVEAAHALAEAAVLVPKGVICLISALQYHELTLQMPSAVWMAIDRAAWRPKINYPPIRFVRFTGSALTEGIERHSIENIDVPITDPARTIVDCFRTKVGFRYRTKVGLDVAMVGLREGLRRGQCKPDQLWRYARKARVWSTMRPYVEAMASDAA
jgi:predicted transcriptional regulator of viral defense system